LGIHTCSDLVVQEVYQSAIDHIRGKLLSVFSLLRLLILLHRLSGHGGITLAMVAAITMSASLSTLTTGTTSIITVLSSRHRILGGSFIHGRVRTHLTCC